MIHRLALVAQTLWAAVLASLQVTLDGILRGLANPETRWREAKLKEQK